VVYSLIIIIRTTQATEYADV